MFCTPHSARCNAGDELWFLCVVSGTSFVVLGGDAAGAPFPLPGALGAVPWQAEEPAVFTGVSSAQSRSAKIIIATCSC